jgi:hypothetical protein
MKPAEITQKIESYCYERYLGIHTTGYAASAVQGGVHYTPLPYRVIDEILDRLSLGADDVFVDIGCGKGRVVCCARRWLLRRVVAIEVNELPLKATIENAARVRGGKTPVESLAVSADAYDYPDATAIYLYNPFGRPIMDKVFAKVDQSFKRNPRSLQVVYANCLHEGVLRELKWLVKRDEWPSARFPGFGCPISFWSSKA